MKKIYLGIFLWSMSSSQCFALKVNMALTDNSKISIGTLELTETQNGVLIKPDLHHLPPGSHGFHVHVNSSCEDQGMAAGAHFDPHQTGKHRGPNAEGHLGDLPILKVNTEGKATNVVLAPRMKISDFRGHSVMIHSGGDNYSDTPEKLGGGGARIACGVVEK
jgi:Cu-Zn family superoxide dismutase